MSAHMPVLLKMNIRSREFHRHEGCTSFDSGTWLVNSGGPPKLLAPSKFDLIIKTALPTREADILMHLRTGVLQVLALRYCQLLVFLDIELGPNGRVSIPEYRTT